MLHQEADDVAMGATAEAMEKGLVVIDRERRRLFLVKRTEADMLAAAAGQANATPHHLAGRHTGANIVEKLRRQAHAPPARVSFTSADALAKSMRPA